MTRGLVIALGGDGASASGERIFRLPGTRNLPTKSKRAKGRTECDAALLSFNGSVHPLEAFPADELRTTRKAGKRSPPAGCNPPPDWMLDRMRRDAGLGLSSDPDDLLQPPDPTAVEAALAVIPSDGYQFWFQVCAAIRSALGDAGFPLFENWSRKSTKYDPGQCAQKWADCAFVTGYTAGTIFYLANKEDPNWRDRVQTGDRDADAPGSTEQQENAQRAESDGPRQAKKSRLNDLLSSASDLQHRRFAPQRWIVPRYITEGVTVLAGRPKIGKSWLALDIAVGVATGGACLGETCEQGDVLALFLEDTDRRIQQRLTKMLGAQVGDWPSRLQYATEWSLPTRGGLDMLREWIAQREKPRLIVVDVLERIRQRDKTKDAAYAADYAAIADLQKLAGEAQLSVLVLHHQRKAAADDPFDTVSGTLGLTGAADAALILGNDQTGKHLYGRGRDLEEFDVAMRQGEKNMRWEVLGSAGEVNVSAERAAIIEVLRSAGRAMPLQKIVEAVGSKYDNVKQLLTKMYHDGEVDRVGPGAYQLPRAQGGLDMTPDGHRMP